ncbi:MAG: hypothetical protein M5U19_18420 [Microthrixaceae bacterium]|nr:hypothetical protein [Microthrixaceae bacterium]
MNCSKPACLEACPRDSIYRREEDGVILIDEERCHGYRFCMEACPYKRIYFNEQRVVAQKCISCFPRLENGVAPACVRQCPGRVRHLGHIDDPDSSIHKLVRKWKVALPLRPDFEVEPNVFYVPPMLPTAFDENGEFDEEASRMPIEELRDLFGPGVDQALATIASERDKVAAGGHSELMDMLIAHDWKRPARTVPRGSRHVGSAPAALAGGRLTPMAALLGTASDHRRAAASRCAVRAPRGAVRVPGRRAGRIGSQR